MLQKNINNISNQGRNTSNTSISIGNLQLLNADDTSNDNVLNLVEDMVFDSSTQVVRLNVMCILYHHLFGNLDQKMFATVIDTNKKVRTELCIALGLNSQIVEFADN